ncbi:MAG: protoporphyrinogen oxidase [Pyrinomonadaceae bacterium]
MKKAAVIGGGISGLTTAFLLKRRGVDVRVFEASADIGGNIQTTQKDGYIIEQGPNSLLRSPRLVDLVKMLGLESEVVAADPAAQKRYILWGGRLEPMGPKSFINGYFSLKTILALAREPFVRSRSPEGESVAEFVTRRISREFLDKAIDPFVSGVYAGDPYDLSMRSAFPKLYEMERDFGSLIMGTLRRKVEKADPAFPRTFSFRGGLTTLIKKLADEIGEEQINRAAPVDRIEQIEGRTFRINGHEFDAVVVSTPAWVAAELVRDRDAELAEKLASVKYPQVAVAVTAFKKEQIGRDLDGFGFLIASREERPILGTLFHSAVFPERAPNGRHLLMTFIGGVRSGEGLDQMSDEEVRSLVVAQLRELIGVKGEPELFHLKRWRRAIPQYRVGYEKVTEACAAFEKQNPGLYFCSNFYRGISMGDCVKNAFQTAADVNEYLSMGS